jgi:hypothetical protein
MIRAPPCLQYAPPPPTGFITKVIPRSQIKNPQYSHLSKAWNPARKNPKQILVVWTSGNPPDPWRPPNRKTCGALSTPLPPGINTNFAFFPFSFFFFLFFFTSYYAEVSILLQSELWYSNKCISDITGSHPSRLDQKVSGLMLWN